MDLDTSSLKGLGWMTLWGGALSSMYERLIDGWDENY